MRTRENTWTRMLDEAIGEPQGQPDASHRLCDYLLGEASAAETRAFVEEVERRIKATVGHGGGLPEGSFRSFSESEAYLLDDCLRWRGLALDNMMRQPSEEETERMGRQNDRLHRLTGECHERCRDMWLTLYETPHKQNDRYLYKVEGKLRFEYDDDAVISMANDGYYGSDFRYMIHLREELMRQRLTRGDEMEFVLLTFVSGSPDGMAGEFANELDDGVSWKEGHLDNPAFDKYCICHALHALHTHQDYCLPDILRMDDFVVTVNLRYDNEVCSTRDTEDRGDPHWPEGLPRCGASREDGHMK